MINEPQLVLMKFTNNKRRFLLFNFVINQNCDCSTVPIFFLGSKIT